MFVIITENASGLDNANEHGKYVCYIDDDNTSSHDSNIHRTSYDDSRGRKAEKGRHNTRVLGLDIETTVVLIKTAVKT